MRLMTCLEWFLFFYFKRAPLKKFKLELIYCTIFVIHLLYLSIVLCYHTIVLQYPMDLNFCKTIKILEYCIAIYNWITLLHLYCTTLLSYTNKLMNCTTLSKLITLHFYTTLHIVYYSVSLLYFTILQICCTSVLHFIIALL